MFLNQSTPITGFITQEKFLLGRTLAEIECVLGFHSGRRSKGAIVLALSQKPQPHEFEGY